MVPSKKPKHVAKPPSKPAPQLASKASLKKQSSGKSEAKVTVKKEGSGSQARVKAEPAAKLEPSGGSGRSQGKSGAAAKADRKPPAKAQVPHGLCLHPGLLVGP